MNASSKIAVVGATGRVGRHVVDLLTARGSDVVAVSRSAGVDVVTGAGLAEALTGVEVVIDAATSPSPDQRLATEFFTASAANLHAAGTKAGVQHIVEVSIINVDQYTAGYGAAKAAHERAMLAGPIPVTILRAAQFHELVEQFVQWGRQDGVVAVPRLRTQSIAARTVAGALVELALEPKAAVPAGAPVPEIAGPQEETLADLARLLTARRGERVQVMEVDDATDADRRLEATGGLLPSPHATLAGPSFQDWLDAAS